MAISRVEYDGNVLMDISNDTVNKDNLLVGATAHGSDGEPIEGAVITHNVIDNLVTDSGEDALSARQGKILDEKVSNKYTKPSDGIPKDDLSEEVKESLDKAENSATEEWVLDNAKNAYYSKGYYCVYHDMMYGTAWFNMTEEEYDKLKNYDLPTTMTETFQDGSVEVITIDQSNFNESTRDITVDADLEVVINQKDFRLNTKTLAEAIPSEANVREWGFAYQEEIPTQLASLSGDSNHRTVTDEEKENWSKKSSFSGDYNDLINKPTIPSKLSDLNDDATHRVVSDTEKEVWNTASTNANNALEQVEELTPEISSINEDLTQSSDWLKSKNLWDEKTIGGYYNSSGEVVNTQDELRALNRFNVPSNNTLYSNKSLNWVFWNGSAFLSRIVGTNHPTIPSGATQFSFALTNTYGKVYLNDVMISDSSDTTYHAYSSSNVELTQIVDNAIHNYFLVTNIFDGVIELGGLNIATGENVSSTSRTRSANFIEVKPNTTYTITRNVLTDNFNVMGYNANKVVVNDGTYLADYKGLMTSFDVNVKTKTFRTTPTTKYIRWYHVNSANLTEKISIQESVEYIPSNLELKENLTQIQTLEEINGSVVGSYSSSTLKSYANNKMIVTSFNNFTVTNNIPTWTTFANIGKPIKSESYGVLYDSVSDKALPIYISSSGALMCTKAPLANGAKLFGQLVCPLA